MPRRLLGWFIDVVALVILIFIGASLVTAILGPTVNFRPDATTSSDLITVATGMVVLQAIVSTGLSATYFVIPWMVQGASPGQRLLGMRVHGAMSGPLTPGRAVVRWVLLLPPLGTVAVLARDLPKVGALLWGTAPIWYLVLLLTTARSPTKQGLHDRIAGSVVRQTHSETMPAEGQTGVEAAGRREPHSSDRRSEDSDRVDPPRR